MSTATRDTIPSVASRSELPRAVASRDGRGYESGEMTPAEALPKLSKSRFLSGLQCHRRLWLESYRPELAPERDAWTLALFGQGTAVGVVARQRFPGGTLVDEDHIHYEDAVARTRALLDDPFVPAIYEAAFTEDDVRIRVDVLVRRPDGRFDLYEVKATAGVKEIHLADVAVQLRVIERSGVPVARVFLLHLDRSYIYQGGRYDLARLFAAADLTELARLAVHEVEIELGAMRRPLSRPDVEPAVPTGPHCASPFACPFTGWCDREAPLHPVEEIPRLRDSERLRLDALGIGDIRDIPRSFDGFGDPRKRRVVESVRSGRRIVEPGAAEALAALYFPVHFLDFETFGPALPAFPGTHPYDTVPFQWSDHVLDESGALTHREYLHTGPDDPRRGFAETLVAATRDAATIVVWTSYEDRCLGELADALPDLAPALEDVRARLFDLHPVVRENVYDPAFHGSFSMKRVLPALVPELAYDDLAIRDGGTASLTYAELRDPATPPERAAALRTNLLAYCRRDTEAMVALWRHLASAEQPTHSLS